MPTDQFLDVVKQTLQTAFPDGKILVTDMTGTRDHLEINLKSQKFKGLTLIKQHKLVMDALTELLKGQLHAVKIKTEVLE